MTKLSLILAYLLLCNIAHAQPAAYWCDAPFPPPAGSDRTMGKDSNGQVCIKIAKEMPSTAPPLPAVPETAIVPKEGAIVQPAKDLLRSQGDVEGISVTLSTNPQGEPVLTAICPGNPGFNEYDLKALELGFKQKVVTRGKETFVIYEK